MFEFHDPEAAREEAGEVFECVFLALAHFGLNLQLAKTKALVHFCGAGHQEAKRRFNDYDVLEIPVAAARQAIAVVRASRMLGTMIADDGSPGDDVTVKVATARASTEPLRREVHKRKELSATDKATLADATVLNQLSYNTGTWPELNQSQHRQFSKQYYANYAAAQGITWKARKAKLVTNMQIAEGVDRPGVDGYLRLQRLRLLARVLASGPRHLRRLLGQAWRDDHG